MAIQKNTARMSTRKPASPRGINSVNKTPFTRESFALGTTIAEQGTQDVPTPPQYVMEGIDYPGYDGPLVASYPLSRFAPVPDLHEATLLVRAHVSGTEGQYFAAVPSTEAMAPAHVAGQYIVFQPVDARRRPVDGDVVYGWVEELETWHRKKPKILTQLVCIRRYGHDANGAETLTALSGGFTSWTASKSEGRETNFLIVGVATPYRPWAQDRNRTQVWVARGTMALGYFPENEVNMDGVK